MSNNIEMIYALAPMQEGMLFHNYADNTSTEYFLQYKLTISGELKTDYVKKSLLLLSKKYEVLRTSFASPKTAKQPLQVVFLEREIELKEVNLCTYDFESQLAEIEFLKKEDLKRGFRLDKDSLLRVTLIRITYSKTIVLWSVHHIIVDGWCNSILLQEFMRFYELLSQGRSIDQLSSLIQEESLLVPRYKDYIEYINKKDRKEGLNYWNYFLKDYNEVAEIKPVAFVDPSEKDVDTQALDVRKHIVKKIHKCAVANKVTVSTILEAAWGILLQKYNNTKDVIFGKVVSGRNVDLQGIEQAVGLFINTVPTRILHEDQTNTIQLLEQVQMQAYESMPYEYCQLADVQNLTKLGNSLIQSLYIFENYYTDNNVMQVDAEIQIEKIESWERTNYPITFSVYSFDGLRLEISYNPNLYSKTEILMILKRVEKILDQLAGNVCLVDDIDILDDEERKLILQEFNNTKIDLVNEKTVVDLFEEQVEKAPDNVAVAFLNQSISYRELNEHANSLAYQLRDLGVGRDDFVAIISERSIEMIIGIYSVIKAGGAYVPIDPSYPEQRIKYILTDCNPKVILLGEDKYKHFIEDNKFILLTDDICKNRVLKNPEHINTSKDLVYLIYTSGTTGRPKGVMNCQEGLVNRILWMNYKYPLSYDDVILQKTTYTFDVSVWEIIWWSFVGAKVVMLVPGGEKEPDTIIQTIEKEKVSVMHFVPSMMDMFLTFLSANSDEVYKIASLKYIFSSGEALGTKSLKNFNNQIRSIFTNTRLINLYGPTEASIDVTYFDCEYDDRRVPIGKPIANTCIYIMDKNRLCGIGVPGELCIAGIGLARGYLKLPELTDKKFIQNPFSEGKMYKSGDLARWLPDGNIEYLGRLDEQVKVRGFRIELGEIESELNKIPYITGSVVIIRANKEGEKEICAYVTANIQISSKEIRDTISKNLTQYMIPTYIMQIERIPVTHNGKLNKSALPEFELKSNNEYIAPKSDMEILVVSVYEEVLNTKQIGVFDNFFELGGHSLKATRLMTSIEAKTGIRIPLKEIFQNPTPKQLALYMESKASGSFNRIPSAKSKEFYRASSAQKRLYVINEFDTGNTAYNVPICIEVKGLLDRYKVEETLRKLTKRHEALRTSFHTINSEVYQKIDKEINIIFDFEELKEFDSSEKSSLMQSWIIPFNLANAPLMRTKLIHIKDERSILFFDMHHIISDGMTMNIVTEEFSALYNNKNLKPANLQYKDYSEWMLNRKLDEQRDYWLSQFNDTLPTLDLPYDYPRPQIQSFYGQRVMTKISWELRQKVKRLSELMDATEYMIYLSALMILLGKMGNQEDVIIGSPISGRVHKDTEQIMGVFVNTLAMRGKPKKDKLFNDFLKEIKNMLMQAYENQEYAFEELIEELKLQRDVSRNPLFDILFTMQNNNTIELELNGLGYEVIELQHNIAKFDLSISISEDKKGYELEVEYRIDLFKEENIQRMMHHYLNILQEICNHSTIKIENISMLDDEEKNLVLNVFNHNRFENYTDKTIVEQFEQQVEKTPDKKAVVYNRSSLTYRELNDKADKLAVKLCEYDIQPDDFVVIITERSLEMVVGIYGIIKSGAAYVPIDTNYPIERIRFILNDCKPKLVLLGNEEIMNQMAETLNELKLVYLLINIISNDENRTCILEKCHNANNLLYAIYTSGTTGKPKGVMIEERGVLNLCNQLYQYIYADYTTSQNVILIASYSFDASVQQIFTPLLHGHCLHVLSDDVRYSSDLLAQYIYENDISVMDGTPNHLKLLAEVKQLPGWHLEKCIIGGEELPCKVLELIYSKVEELQIFNVYGPTETTVDATIYTCTKKDLRSKKISIGHPLDKVKVYVLNGNSLCGIGIPGELCIGGIGVARGYVNNESQTNEKFVKNPFSEGRMYRSGDLAMWHSDGKLEFLGRYDNQVKIRGYRVELNEIETVLRDFAEIKDAVVAITEDKMGEKQIYAYVVSDVCLDIKELKKSISNKLPHYMIPAGIMQLHEIPLNTSGKIDYYRLPSIEIKNDNSYLPPSNTEEEILTEIFGEVLGINRLGIMDNFYDLGGDSIKAIRALSRIRDKGYLLTLRDIMEMPIIENLAARLEKDTKKNMNSQDELRGECPLTPIQQHYFKRQLRVPNHYNQSILIKGKVPLDTEALEFTLKAIVRHNDILRAVFIGDKQIILGLEESKLIDFQIVNLSAINDECEILGREIEKINNNIQRSFNLSEGPLVKVALYNTTIGDHLFICIHHLIMDGISWRILLEELIDGYHQFTNNKSIVFHDKTASYRQWSEFLLDQSEKTFDISEIDYWKTTLLQMTKYASRYGDYREVSVQLSTESFELDEEVTAMLQIDANKAFHTYTEELLLVALLQSASKLFGREEVSVELESHGRQLLDQEITIDRTIGWFTCIYPIIIAAQNRLIDTIINTKEYLRRVPNKGMGYQLLKDKLLVEENDKVADICFNFLGDFETEIINSGLFTFSEFSTGEDIAIENGIQNNMELNCFIQGKKLIFNITYQNQMFTKEDIELFIQNYIVAITEIIELCASQKDSVMTTSDYGAEDMSKDEVAFLNELLNF